MVINHITNTHGEENSPNEAQSHWTQLTQRFNLAERRQVCATYHKADTELSEFENDTSAIYAFYYQNISHMVILSTTEALATQGHETFLSHSYHYVR